LLSSGDTILKKEPINTIELTTKILKTKGIDVLYNCRVKEVTEYGVILEDGRSVEGNVVIWATGADPHEDLTNESQLHLLKGYYRVNSFLQSTSHPNVFAGGDCNTLEDYQDKGYPTKAGVYAVREGPIIAKNLISYLNGKPLA